MLNGQKKRFTLITYFQMRSDETIYPITYFQVYGLSSKKKTALQNKQCSALVYLSCYNALTPYNVINICKDIAKFGPMQIKI
jgi:hypothetical protein